MLGTKVDNWDRWGEVGREEGGMEAAEEESKTVGIDFNTLSSLY